MLPAKVYALFVHPQAGQLLNVMFGADAPRLTRTIEQELHNEELAKKGERERPKRAPHELTPPEQVCILSHMCELAEFNKRAHNLKLCQHLVFHFKNLVGRSLAD